MPDSNRDDCSPSPLADIADPDVANAASVACSERAESTLPTFQRNVLRKYFRRANFTAADVAEIDYQRLVRFPGVGAKGMQNIRAWLHNFGLELRNVPLPVAEGSGKDSDAAGKTQRIERAIALLRKQGFVVRPSRSKGDSSSDSR
jgi:hypothetical protein